MFHWSLGYLFFALLTGALGYGEYHTKMDGLARYMSAVFSAMFTLSLMYGFWQKRTRLNNLVGRKD
ncbi:MAG: hypothetical protein VX642_02745 [Bdellovibrionota bacterium]|nr:hypothetical protein [Bdellovibrionota bacterium]